MTEQQIEEFYAERGITGPRVTSQTIDDAIVCEDYHVFPETTVTVCCLTLVNGHSVVGHHCFASRKLWNREIGRKLAKKAARDRIWELESYLLRQNLHDRAYWVNFLPASDRG